MDAAGNLYVADGNGRIQRRDVQGNWSVLATDVYPAALVVDTAGNLYAASGDIQKRDAQGKRSVLATYAPGFDLGSVNNPRALAVDGAGNLYVAESWRGQDICIGEITCGRIQTRDTQGTWSLLTTNGGFPDQRFAPAALAVDAPGNV